MARRYVDNKSLNKSTTTRRSSHTSTTKILPGSESKWKNRNDSIVNETYDNLMNAKFKNTKVKRLNHWSNAKAEVSISGDDFFKTNKPDPYFNVETDFGPGNSLRGISDASQKTLDGNNFKVKQTIYGKKIVKNNVKETR